MLRFYTLLHPEKINNNFFGGMKTSIRDEQTQYESRKLKLMNSKQQMHNRLLVNTMSGICLNYLSNYSTKTSDRI